MEQAERIAQKIVLNAKDQSGTGLLSWQDSAASIIIKYAEDERLDALQEALEFIEERERAYGGFGNRDRSRDDHFFRGYLAALDKVKQKVIELKGEELPEIT